MLGKWWKVNARYRGIVVEGECKMCGREGIVVEGECIVEGTGEHCGGR